MNVRGYKDNVILANNNRDHKFSAMSSEIMIGLERYEQLPNSFA